MKDKETMDKNFSSSFPLDVSLDSLAIWKKGEQFVIVLSPPKGKKGTKQTTPSVAFTLITRIYKEKEGMYTGECPALQVASQGDFEQEARANILEAVTLFLEDCVEVGTLENVLLKRRFKEMHPQRRADHNETIRGIITSIPHDTSQEKWQDRSSSDKSALVVSSSF